MDEPHPQRGGTDQRRWRQVLEVTRNIRAREHCEFTQAEPRNDFEQTLTWEQIKAKESKVNLLVLSAGFLTMEGRNETEEGLDKKLSVHYYSRMRFTQQLQPLLAKAAKEPRRREVYARSIRIKTTENSPVNDRQLRVLRMVYDEITKYPRDHWIALIAVVINRYAFAVSRSLLKPLFNLVN